MQRFKDILETLNSADHIKEIQLYHEDNLHGVIKSKPGSMGSLLIKTDEMRANASSNADSSAFPSTE